MTKQVESLHRLFIDLNTNFYMEKGGGVGYNISYCLLKQFHIVRGFNRYIDAGPGEPRSGCEPRKGFIILAIDV